MKEKKHKEITNEEIENEDTWKRKSGNNDKEE